MLLNRGPSYAKTQSIHSCFFFERIPNLPAANVIPNLVDSGLDQQNENWNEAERGAWGTA